MAIDFAVPEEIAELEGLLHRFGEERLRPEMRDAERIGSWNRETLQILDQFGVGVLDVPEELGGEGAGLLAKVTGLEAIAWGDAGGLLAADPGPATAAVVSCPDRSLVSELAEPWLAREAGMVLHLLPRDEELATPRVEWTPGWPPPRHVWVCNGSSLALYSLDGVTTPDAPALAFHASGGVGLSRVGADPVECWALSPVASRELRGRARLWPAAVAVGIAQASFDYAVAYAQERVVAGRAVAHHQGNAFAIAEAAARLEGARLMVRGAACRFDAGDPGSGTLASLAYLEALDMAPDVCDLGVQLLGGHGYVEDHPVEKWFRESRMLAQLWGGRELALDDAGAGCGDLEHMDA